ncbi:MAG: KamA family radical SAM protein [Syntrophobacteraceae bacterium]|nr:KamA family radical SAM protein [Desulfobacteraceae bacterium]
MISLETFIRKWGLDPVEYCRVADRFPFRLSRHCMGLIRSPGDPVWRQVVPDPVELRDPVGLTDPLAEEALSPVPNLVHRYPNRVLWLVSTQCAAHCRFCTRKRRWTSPVEMTERLFREGLDYIRRHSEVKDVLLSGGDPLMLPDPLLESILKELRGIRHVEVIRIGTRVPVFFPERVTPELAGMLSRYHPVFLNLHFNHPLEITPESGAACRMLADAGIPLGSQTVLLKGVNDRAEVLGELFQGLLALRVRPYYLMQMDLALGTGHFRTPIATGLEIVKSLRNRISGLAMPHFVVDLPGGHGKVPMVPNFIENISEDVVVFRDYLGNRCEYPLLAGEHEELGRLLKR